MKMTEKEMADACTELGVKIIDAAKAWSDAAPHSDADKVKIVCCAYARIAAEAAKAMTGGDPNKATEFMICALADAFGARVVTESEMESARTFQGKPIVGHC